MLSIVLRAVLAMIIGGVLGFERGLKNRPAGFRTYMLVCLGSAMVMMTSQYIAANFEFKTDLARLGAQVISGIGFLGAGTIIVTKRNQIRGITTAASLWVSACLGLAVGIGFYSGAIVGLLSVFTIMAGMYSLDERIKKRAKQVNLYIEFGAIHDIAPFVEFIREQGLEIRDINIGESHVSDNSHTAVVVSLVCGSKVNRSYVVEVVSKVKGIRFIEEI